MREARPYNPDIMTPDAIFFRLKGRRDPLFIRIVVRQGEKDLGPAAWRLIEPYVREAF